MDQWLHCNACVQRVAKGVEFFLTSCGHIYCGRCRPKCVDPCFVCGQKCKVVILNDKLEPKLQHLFTAPELLFKKAVECMNFQQRHRSRLIKQMSDKIERQSKIFSTAEEAFKSQREEIKKLHSENVLMKKYLNSVKSQIPLSRPRTPQQMDILSTSPGMRSPQYLSRSQLPLNHGYPVPGLPGRSMRRVYSPANVGQKTPGQMQCTPPQRLSMCPKPRDGRWGTLTPSPRTLKPIENVFKTSSPYSTKEHGMASFACPQKQVPATPNISYLFAKSAPTPPATPKLPADAPLVTLTKGIGTNKQ